MLRYMAGVKWQDGKSSTEVRDMCGVVDLSVKVRQRRLRWFGHIRRVEGSLLNEVEEMMIVGRRPVGRPKKKWRSYLTEDMNTLGTEEYMAHNCQLWKAVIACPPHLNGNLWMLNDDDDDDDDDDIQLYCTICQG